MNDLKICAAVIQTAASNCHFFFLSCPLYFDLLPFQAVIVFSLADQRQFVSELNVTSIFPQVRCLNQFMSFLSNREMLEKTFGISGLKAALNFGSRTQMKQID